MEVFAKQSKLVIGMVGLPGRGKVIQSTNISSLDLSISKIETISKLAGHQL